MRTKIFALFAVSSVLACVAACDSQGSDTPAPGSTPAATTQRAPPGQVTPTSMAVRNTRFSMRRFSRSPSSLNRTPHEKRRSAPASLARE